DADNMPLTHILHRNYDVRETQTFHDTMKTEAIEDPRIELDRCGDRKRSEERRKSVDAFISSADSAHLSRTLVGATNMRGKSLSMDRNLTVVVNRLAKNQEKMSDDVKAKIANGEILAGDGEFENIMSALKRDNGIMAFYYDMYKLSARNLSQSLAV